MHRRQDHDIARARSALQAIPAGLPRTDWVRVGMAAQAAGLDFGDFDAWSAQADNYEPHAARDTWKSFKPDGGIGEGTLFKMAADHGGRSSAASHWNEPSKARPRPAEAAKPQRPGVGAADVWGRLKPAPSDHPYLVRKAAAGVALDMLRVVPAGDPLHIIGESMAGALVVPCLRPDGTIATLQFIAPPETSARLRAKGKTDKPNLPGQPVVGCFTVGEVSPGGTLFVCEGIATAWACWQATGAAAVVCFGWGRVRAVAKELRLRDASARLVLLPDRGKEGDAHTIAAEVDAAVAAMPHGEPQNFDANDYAQREGFDALELLLSRANDPPPSLPPQLPFTVVPFGDLALAEPPPPAYVWAGWIPAGHVTVLAAHGGTGKSMVALMLVVSVALGLPLFGIPTRKGVVAFYSGEDGAGLLRYRLRLVCRAMGVDVADLAGRLFILDATDDDPTLFAEVTTAGRREGTTTTTYGGLRDFANAHAVSMLVVDNASDAFDASEIDRARVRGFMRALARIARERDAGLLLLAHVDKGTSRGERGQNSEGYSGSTAWHNSARSRIFMSRDKDGALLLEHKKHNLGKLCEPMRLVWPEGGVPIADEAPGPMVQGISDRGHTKGLLKLIAEFAARGEFVSTATTSRTHAAKLLHGEPSYPKLKDAEVFDLLRRAERAGQLERVQFKGNDRHQRERWQVTATGAAIAGIPTATAGTAGTAATCHVTAPNAPAASPAATAATSPLGGVGETAPQEVAAQAAAGGGDGC